MRRRNARILGVRWGGFQGGGNQDPRKKTIFSFCMASENPWGVQKRGKYKQKPQRGADSGEDWRLGSTEFKERTRSTNVLALGAKCGAQNSCRSPSPFLLNSLERGVRVLQSGFSTTRGDGGGGGSRRQKHKVKSGLSDFPWSLFPLQECAASWSGSSPKGNTVFRAPCTCRAIQVVPI